MRPGPASLLLLAVLLPGCGGGGGGVATSAEKLPDPPKVAAADFTAPDGAFSIAMPGQPRERSQDLQSPAGPVRIRTFLYEDADQRTFFVSYTELTPAMLAKADPEQLLLGGLRGMRSTPGWTMVGQAPVEFRGHPGYEVELTVRLPNQPEAAGLARVYVIGDRVYQIQAIGPGSTLPPERRQAFVESFRLLKDVAPMRPAVAAAAPPAPAPAGPASPPAGSKAIAPPGRMPNRTAGLRDRRPGRSIGSRPGTPPPSPEPGSEPPRRAPDPAPAPDRPTIAAAPAPDRPRDPGPAAPAPRASGGASIAAFEWLDESEDVVGGHGDASKPDGTKDYHFKLGLEVPDATTIEAMALFIDDFDRWVTQPSPRYWPVAVFRGKEALSRDHVEKVGTFSGKETLDLYINPGSSYRPGTRFRITLELRVDGQPATIGSECLKP